MNSSITVDASLLPNLSTLSDLLNLLASLRDLTDPFGSPDGLRSALNLLLQLGNTLGLNPNYLTWLSAIENSSQLFNLVLAIGHYLESLLEPAIPAAPPAPQPITANDDSRTEAIDFTRLLPILAEILQLLQLLRIPSATS